MASEKWSQDAVSVALLKRLSRSVLIASGSSLVVAANDRVDLSASQATFVASGPVLAGGHDSFSFVNLATCTYDFLFSLRKQILSGLTATVRGQVANVHLGTDWPARRQGNLLRTAGGLGHA